MFVTEFNVSTHPDRQIRNTSEDLLFLWNEDGFVS
jgi:hypothetical protein